MDFKIESLDVLSCDVFDKNTVIFNIEGSLSTENDLYEDDFLLFYDVKEKSFYIDDYFFEDLSDDDDDQIELQNTIIDFFKTKEKKLTKDAEEIFSEIEHFANLEKTENDYSFSIEEDDELICNIQKNKSFYFSVIIEKEQIKDIFLSLNVEEYIINSRQFLISNYFDDSEKEAMLQYLSKRKEFKLKILLSKQ